MSSEKKNSLNNGKIRSDFEKVTFLFEISLLENMTTHQILQRFLEATATTHFYKYNLRRYDTT